ncbi:MAG: hypothetical protein ACW99U_02280 [Candidatus Thorarchaeota archaeon]
MVSTPLWRLRALLLIIVVITIPFSSIPSVLAIESRHAGLSSVEDILNSNTTIWTFNGHAAPSDVDMIHTLAEAGIKIMHIESWWGDPINNPLDIFYNETFRRYSKEALNFTLYGTPVSYEGLDAPSAAAIDPNDLWGVTLGDEEPAWIHYVDIYSTLSPEIAKYNETYFFETGFYLKPALDMNRTENQVFVEWLNEKTVWVYNFLADHVREQAPNALVFQYTIMHPVWGLADELIAPYELEADGFAMDCFYSWDDPWLLYETIRRYRASMPDALFHMDIWGTIWDFVNEAGDGLHYTEGSYEQIRRETWISYLSGVDVLGWFDWSPQNNDSFSDWTWGPDREDTMGKRNWMYVDNLAGQLTNLPILRSEPEVLVVGTGYQTGVAMQNVAATGLFTEYDLVNQRCFATTDLDLSNYSLIMLTDGWYFDDTIRKLNAFVESGGNLILLGGYRSGDGPLVETELLDIENNSTELSDGGHFLINITRPNLLDLQLYSDAPYYSTYMIQAENLSSDYHAIDGFFRVDENGTPSEIADNPLVLYHNESLPDSGWTLYFGALHSSTVSGTTWETYDAEKQHDLWFLYRSVVTAFADFLGITNSVATNETENMLITQGAIDDGTMLAGIMNFQNEDRDFIYNLDLSQLGFPPGQYWVHSLDEDQSEGQFETNGNLLSFGTHILANGTRLFLISEEKPEPDYSIEIFPRIPSIADVNQTTPPSTDDGLIFIVVAGILALSVSVLALVLIARRKPQD